MVTKLKANFSHLGPGDLHLTEPQQYQWDSGKFLWPSIVHSLKTVKKMKVSIFCFLKQVAVFIVCIEVYVAGKFTTSFKFLLL